MPFTSSRAVRVSVKLAVIVSAAALLAPPITTMQATAAAAATSCTHGCNVQYFDGPVLSSTTIVLVRWGALTDDASASALAGFSAAVGGSGYLDGLKEYSTNVTGGTNQTVTSASTFAGTFTITPSVGNGSGLATVTDAQLRTELDNQIGAHHLPQKTASTIYEVLFPPNDTIQDPSGGKSLQQFCAYHDSGDTQQSPLYYIVMPDLQAAGGGCGGSTYLQALTSTTAHELAESITDPQIGFASTVAAPLAWYDSTYGEIGDMCVSTEKSITLGTSSYFVQSWYSRARNDCVFGNPMATITSHPDALTSSTSASFAFVGTDPDGLATNVTCHLDGAADAPCTSPQDFTGLASGSHTFSVTATNSASRSGTSTYTWAVDATPPTIAMTAPSTGFQTSTTMTARYSASDAHGPLTYDVRERYAPWNGSFTGYTTIATGITATSTSIIGALGREYCFSARAYDALGNVSGWSPDKCTALPVDDRTMTALTSGWSRLTATAALAGTYTKTSTLGAQLRLSNAKLDRMALVVTRCSTCGSIAIYLNGVYWRTVSTASSTTQWKYLLVLPAFSVRTTTITLKVTTSGKPVYVDGLGATRN